MFIEVTGINSKKFVLNANHISSFFTLEMDRASTVINMAHQDQYSSKDGTQNYYVKESYADLKEILGFRMGQVWGLGR
jgi:uncharacterized protein YlzI (FlbEa/FlbD family)